MEGIQVPASRKYAAYEIAGHGWRKILLLGSVDSGKSTFCQFLALTLLHKSAIVAIVDADIGQKDVWPPASITMGYPKLSDKPSKTNSVAFYFVGTVNPVRHLLPMVVGTQKLVGATRASYVIINTTGLLHGFRLKCLTLDHTADSQRNALIMELCATYLSVVKTEGFNLPGHNSPQTHFAGI